MPSRSSDHLSICFVAHFAYGALSGGNAGKGFIGGVERQTGLMAKWFAAHGYPVSMLTCDEGQEDGLEIDRVRVFKMCRREAGIKGLRFLWPKWTSLVSAMRRADADIYYQNCGEYITGQVALWCGRHGRKFVYSVASDPDCDPALPRMCTIRERVLYRYGLRKADRVIVQTRRQQKMLRNGFGCDSVVIPMPCPGPADADYSLRVLPSGNSQRVLWIGRICEQKRPDRLLDLAEACPDLSLDLVGPGDGTEYCRGVLQRAERIPNVSVCGPASRDRVPEFYQRAALMCCTSDFEGFPNTFLEAWSHGLPIVSSFDPDDLIAEKGMGIVAHDAQGLASAIRALIGNPRRWRRASDAARRYYLANHTIDAVMPRFEKLFSELISMKHRAVC